MNQIYDPFALAFQELSSTIEWKKLTQQSSWETALYVYKNCPPQQSILKDSQAASYLRKLMSFTEATIVEHHDKYGYLRWLWYLRHTPDTLFMGSHSTTGGYDRFLAEILLSRFILKDSIELTTRISFPVDASAFRHIAKYIGRVKFLSQLHVLYRCIGKGMELEASGPKLKTVPNAIITNAIKVYDHRIEKASDGQHTLNGAGLGLTNVIQDIQEWAAKNQAEESTAFLYQRCDPYIACSPTLDSYGKSRLIDIQARYYPITLNLAQALALMSKKDSNLSYLADLTSLIQLLMLVPIIQKNVSGAYAIIFQQGYVLIEEEQLFTIVDHYLPQINEQLAPLTPELNWPTDFTHWYRTLKTVPAPMLFSPCGKVVHKFANAYLLDIANASNMLLRGIKLPRSPAVGTTNRKGEKTLENLRSEKFELQCQEIINSTAWKPEPEIEKKRREKLRQRGKDLTDIDAIGTKNQILLLVECKSLIYDIEYDMGEYRVIRNTQSTVDQAVSKWSGLINNFKNQPKGDNYDFSEFKEIVGVVCTPFEVYSNNNDTLAFVKIGLRACSSLNELRRWLLENG